MSSNILFNSIFDGAATGFLVASGAALSTDANTVACLGIFGVGGAIVTLGSAALRSEIAERAGILEHEPDHPNKFDLD